MVDLLVHPQLAKGDQIVAIPTLVRKLPEPIRKVIGDLSNAERTLVGLQLRPARLVDKAGGRKMTTLTIDQLVQENEELRRRLEEAEDALRALRAGEVDAVLIDGEQRAGLHAGGGR